MKVGKKFKNNDGLVAEIIEYFDCKNCTIRFEDGTILKNIESRNLRRGSFKNLNYKSFLGIGYIGVGEYKGSSKNINKNKAYNVWGSMIQRCYSPSNRDIGYKDCSVDPEWHNFQNFAKWFEENYDFNKMKGWCLDKDILLKGNRVYSSKNCCFLPSEINQFIVLKNKFKNRELPTGVKIHRGHLYGVVKIKNQNVITKRCKTIKDAVKWYNSKKEEYLKILANKYKESLPEVTYNKLINFKF